MTPDEIHNVAFRISTARDAAYTDGIRAGREAVLNELARVAMTFDMAGADAIWEAIKKVRVP